jgi:polyhydroxyalkanoate synthesis regulator phasin
MAVEDILKEAILALQDAKAELERAKKLRDVLRDAGEDVTDITREIRELEARIARWESVLKRYS